MTAMKMTTGIPPEISPVTAPGGWLPLAMVDVERVGAAEGEHAGMHDSVSMRQSDRGMSAGRIERGRP